MTDLDPCADHDLNCELALLLESLIKDLKNPEIFITDPTRKMAMLSALISKSVWFQSVCDITPQDIKDTANRLALHQEVEQKFAHAFASAT